MFFTKIARIFAQILFGFSVLRLVTGFMVAFTANDNAAMSARYLGTANSGEAINQGFLWLFAAVALGVMTEISKLLSERSGMVE